MPSLKATLAALFAIPAITGVVSSSPKCKCTPGDKCWPKQHDWDKLNKTLDGRLIQPIPPASVCYESQPNHDRKACDIILTQWHSSSFHMSDPASIQYPDWADNPCPPIFANGTSINGDATAGERGCSMGLFPSYVVNATDAKHVAAATKWAAEKNVRLNVKATGHSHLGRSTGYASLSIWTHHMRGIKFHKDFKAQSCSPPKGSKPQMAATIAAGETGHQIYAAMAKHDAIVVAGANPTVGIMGWFTGGGHGPLSSSYGMGSDNLLEATVVTTAGKVITVNACKNSDLFYALRGGGGGTYGIVTSAVMKAYPSPKTSIWSVSGFLADPTEQGEKSLYKFFGEMHSDLARINDAGMQGYYYLLGPPTAETLVIMGVFWMYDQPDGGPEDLVKPLLQKLDDLQGNGTVFYQSNFTTAPNFFDSYSNGASPEAVAQGGFALGGRLLTTKSLEDSERVSQTLRAIGPSFQNRTMPTGALIGHMIANRSNKDLESGLNPAWRDTVTSLIAVGGWSDGTPDEVIQAIRDDITHNKTRKLRELDPDSGAYFNEMDAFEPNWQYAAFGTNYPRLHSIKRKHDPKGVLWCHHCVGSEEWVEGEKGQLCRPEWW